MNVSSLVPTFRHRAVTSAGRLRHFFFPRVTFPNRITYLLYFSSISTIQVEQELSGTRVAIHSRYKRCEIIAEGGIDGYGVASDTTAID